MTDEIHKHDLFLMMESYKNMIESNLQLMEKQDTILNKINNTCQAITSLTDTISVRFDEIKESTKGVTIHHHECAKAQKTYNQKLKDILRDGHNNIEKNQTSQNVKIYGLIGMLLTIILGLIGLIYKLWPSTI